MTLTWQVINGAGTVVWSQFKVTHPNTWWPDLFPDLCKLSLGVSGWDLEGYSETERASSTCAEEWAHKGGPPWGGCCNQHWRSLLRTQSFYVCPGFHRARSLGWCGGKSDFFCKKWGCETTGQAHWKPSSSWDYIKVMANYTLAPYVPGGQLLAECATWCHPLRISFTEQGKKATQWTKGYEWGLRMYIDAYDHGLLFTIRLKIENPPSQSIGPNPVLARQPNPPPQPSTTRAPPTNAPLANNTSAMDSQFPQDEVPTAVSLAPENRLFSLVKGAYTALNHTSPNLTRACWLCFTPQPPYYEGIAQIREYNITSDHAVCPWGERKKLTLEAVSGQGLCIGKVPPGQQSLCNQTQKLNVTDVTDSSGYLVPPNDLVWACDTGLTPCVSLAVFNESRDFCVLVQLVPRILYHEDASFVDAFDHKTRWKREPVSITLAVLLGLGVAAGVGTRTAALIQSPLYYNELRTAIDADLEILERSITKLEESLTSLSEVVLQNRRGLDLLFLKEGGLCAALREECCFYADHSGVIRDSMTKLRERLEKRKRERENQQGWFEGWFNSSPWLTTLLSTLAGPLVILLLILTFGPCIVNRLVQFINDRVSAVKILVLRQRYQTLASDEDL